MTRYCFLFGISLMALLACAFFSCTGEISPAGGNNTSVHLQAGLPGDFVESSFGDQALPEKDRDGQAKGLTVSMDQIAEIERAGAFFPGLALVESEFREKAGDYSGAAVAVYKELSWAFSCGNAGMKQVEEGLQNAFDLYNNFLPELGQRRDSGVIALLGCMAFAREDWKEARELLEKILKADEEPDSFLRWMLLVCALEQEVPEEAASKRSAYSSIRARYARFPEYWYRGARAFSAAEDAGEGSIAVIYAEQCINSNPQGPFAPQCRRVLSENLGLLSDGKDTYSNIRTKAEIENTIRTSVSMNNPGILEELFPLISLPENPYTLYAMGALKVLSSVPEFRTFFIEEAGKSPGRLGDRLSYISRG